MGENWRINRGRASQKCSKSVLRMAGAGIFRASPRGNHRYFYVGKKFPCSANSNIRVFKVCPTYGGGARSAWSWACRLRCLRRSGGLASVVFAGFLSTCYCFNQSGPVTSGECLWSEWASVVSLWAACRPWAVHTHPEGVVHAVHQGTVPAPGVFTPDQMNPFRLACRRLGGFRTRRRGRPEEWPG